MRPHDRSRLRLLLAAPLGAAVLLLLSSVAFAQAPWPPSPGIGTLCERDCMLWRVPQAIIEFASSACDVQELIAASRDFLKRNPHLYPESGIGITSGDGPPKGWWDSSQRWRRAVEACQ